MGFNCNAKQLELVVYLVQVRRGEAFTLLVLGAFTKNDMMPT